MENYFEKYLEASGAKGEELAEARENYSDLLKKIPELNGDLKDSAIKVKMALQEDGFDYHASSNTAQSTLNGKKGNCLGLPLLIGSILKERGIEPNFKVLVNPMTKAGEISESVGYKQIDEGTPYLNPKLPFENSPFPNKIFHPLEHIVIDVGDGVFIETTDSQGDIFKGSFESARDVDFNGALSNLYKDRFILDRESGLYLNGDLIKKGLDLWSENRELIFLASQQALKNFDDENYKILSEKYLGMNDEDSLWDFNSSALTGDEGGLNSAIDKYNHFAQAIAIKAKITIDNDRAKFDYSLAGHLYAESNILKLEDFYIAHALPLSKFYDRGDILDVLGSFSEKENEFNYNMALYKLTGNLDDLDVAGQGVRTPRDKLAYLIYSVGTPLEDKIKLNELDNVYRRSSLYADTKKHLNRGRSEIFHG
jgi:hypothetical protein